MPLTDTAIRNAKPDAKTKRLYDEKGMYLEISPSGGKWFRLKYRIGGIEKRISLGVYPDVSLKTARDVRDALRKQISSGIDPAQARQLQKLIQANEAGNTFEAVAREW